MRKIVFFCTFLLAGIINFACSPIFFSYFIENGNVYYGSDYSKYNTKIETADSKTFKIINPYYAKDKNSVYYNGGILNGLNSGKVEFLGGVGTLIGEDGYIKDDKSVYFLGEKLESADAKTFTVLKAKNTRQYSSYGKDKNHIYFQDKIFDGADSKTFEILDDGYTKDKNGIYYNNIRLAGIDPNNFKKEGNFIKSNGIIYENEEKLDYDYETFSLLKRYTTGNSCDYNIYNGSLVKDKNGIYYRNKKISNIDANSFQVVEDDLFKDKNGYYYGIEDNKAKKINIDPKTAKMYKLELGLIIKDEKNIYQIDDRLRDLKETVMDASTFEPYAVVDGITIFKDKNSFYEADWITIRKVNISSKKFKLIFYNSKLVVLKDDKEVYLGERHSNYLDAGYKKIDINTYSFVNKNSVLEGMGLKLGAFMDKSGLYYTSGSLIRNITNDEYQKLKEFIVSEKDFDEERIEELKKAELEFSPAIVK